jgi:hypothetical protein
MQVREECDLAGLDLQSISSPAIREAIKIAISNGNAVKVISGDWKPKQVVFMERCLSPETSKLIEAACPELRHSETPPTPHNPATEKFVDMANDVVAAFPAKGEDRRWY